MKRYQLASLVVAPILASVIIDDPLADRDRPVRVESLDLLRQLRPRDGMRALVGGTTWVYSVAHAVWESPLGRVTFDVAGAAQKAIDRAALRTARAKPVGARRPCAIARRFAPCERPPGDPR